MSSNKHRLSISLLYSLLLVAGVLLFSIGTIQYYQAQVLLLPTQTPAILMGIGLLSVLFTAGLFPIAWALLISDSKQQGSAGDTQQMVQLLRSINERLLISDDAKRYSGRRHDREVLQRAIQEDLANKDLDSAMRLAKILGEEHGYAQEGEEIREQIQTARAAQYQERINRAINQLDILLAEYRWEDAAAEAAKIQRLFPESHRIGDLQQRVTYALNQHKQDLERQFLEAAKRDDIEQAMGLLAELDKYLTEDEAAPYTEVARGVIGKKKENLGVQFKLAVHDRDWVGAVRVGEQIIREFPNTRMSDEVRSMIDLLRDRAAGQRAVTHGA